MKDNLAAFLRDEIGTGANGHIRMLKADWNDCPLEDADMDVMHEKGESVLNSAMAAWVLPVYAGLCRRLHPWRELLRHATDRRAFAGDAASIAQGSGKLAASRGA